MQQNAMSRARTTERPAPILRTWKKSGIGVLTAFLAVGMGGCQSLEPHAQLPENSSRPVRIAVNPDDSNGVILGEIYRNVLLIQGRNSELVPTEGTSLAQRVELMESGRADLLVGCTGNLLKTFDNQKAESLEKEYAAAKSGASNAAKANQETAGAESKDYLAQTHIDLMGALPTKLETTDPSSATGCSENVLVNLPQNYVVVYTNGLLNRNEDGALTAVTKYLTNQELSSIADAASAQGSVSAAVAQWSKLHAPEKAADS